MLGMNVTLLALLGMQYGKNQRIQGQIAGKVLRFHVLANSDTETAQAVVREAGYGYEVHAAIEETDFPSKTYGKFTFPAGKYEALRVVIGEGAGHNWWCVMYPNMCFEGSMYEVVDESAGEELKKVLSKEEYRAVLEEENYEVRCRYLTFLDGLKE